MIHSILLLVSILCTILLLRIYTNTSSTHSNDYYTPLSPTSDIIIQSTPGINYHMHHRPFVDLPFKVLPGLTFNRNVEYLSDDWVTHISVDFFNHCSKRDDYGGNYCHYEWGQSVSMDITSCNITIPLSDAVVIRGSFKVDLVLDWGFSCRACGQDCSLILPVTKEELVIPMPPCPLDNKNIPKHLQIKLADTSPTNGIPTQMHGHVLIIVENMDEVIADVSVSVWIK